MKTAEEWSKEKKHGWQFAAAKAHENWPAGKMLTESEYDAAVKAACGATLK